jgi:hypothetical protein
MVYKLPFNMPRKEIIKKVLDYDSMREMLKRLEWIEAQCPICYNYDYEGHKPDCAFAKLIKGE